MYVRGELLGYTYVDVATGDSKFTFSTGKIEGWKKLKEVDAPNTNDSNTDDSPVAYSYGDPLRELYPECF